jgi:hypothetical protein
MIKSSKRPKRQSAHGKLKAEADAWVKAIISNRQMGVCLRATYPTNVTCGGPLQGAHILRKGGMYISLRHELDNVVVMCRNHHLFWAHVDEHAFYEWIEQIFPGRIARLKESALHRRKIDLRELTCVLKDIYKKGASQ